MLFRSLPDRPDTRPGERELLTLMDHGRGPGVPVSVGRWVGGGSNLFLRGHRMKGSSPDPHDHFEARPGQRAEWVISLPEAMIRDVEKRLKIDVLPQR
jgi:hypothetical protein